MKLAIAEFLTGAFSLSLRANTGFTASRTWQLPPTLPTTGQVLQVASISANTINLDFATVSGGGGGSVNSVGLSAPADTFAVANSPVTSTGTLALTYTTQTANLVHASPVSGGAGVPTWRALVAADIPALDGSKITTGTVAIARLPVGTAINTVAAGNDTRFHSQNTDVGTSSASFQVNNLATGFRIKDVAGVMQVRNAADTGFADLSVNNLTVAGTTTTVNSETVAIADNILTLNSNVTTGTPTENGGIEISRGSSTNASLIWNETNTRWVAGVAGTESAIARVASRTFVAADLTAGVLTFAHNLGTNNLVWQVWSDTGEAVFPDVISSATNSATFDFKSANIANTWRVVVMG
jgi:hypothetical protein